MRGGFANLLAAEVVSNFGAMLSRLAIPWIAALTLAATPFEMGLLTAADVLAGALASLFLGALVDRLDKRTVMIAADLGRAAVIGALAALAATPWISFPALIACAAASGLLTILFEVARSAWIAQCIAAADLPARNAQISMGTSLSETVAFAIGGWIYQGAGAVLALAVDAATYMVSAAFVRNVASARSVSDAPGMGDAARSMIGDVKAGLRAIAAAPVLRMLGIVEVLAMLAMGIASTSYMIYAARDIGFDPGSLGMIFATGGLGSLAGAAIAPRLGRAWGWHAAMIFGLVLLSLGTFCIPLATDATLAGAGLLIAHQLVGDGGHVIFDVHDRTQRQTSVPQALLGRVDAGIRTLGQLGRLAGALGGGAIAAALGTRGALVVSGAIFTVAAIVVARARFAAPRDGRSERVRT